MKKILSILFLLSASVGISQENTVGHYDNWEFVGYDLEINFYYVDPTSIEEREGYPWFKTLQDFSMPRDDGVNSTVTWFMADCKKLAIKGLLTGYYEEKGAEGKELYRARVKPEWLDASRPSSIANLMIGYACNGPSS